MLIMAKNVFTKSCCLCLARSYSRILQQDFLCISVSHSIWWREVNTAITEKQTVTRLPTCFHVDWLIRYSCGHSVKCTLAILLSITLATFLDTLVVIKCPNLFLRHGSSAPCSRENHLDTEPFSLLCTSTPWYDLHFL